MLNRKKLTVDLCVVGGGIAGVVTAVSSARLGAKVVLMQERPVLGGNASSEIRMWICGAQGSNMRETGIMEEIFLKNYYYNPTRNPYIFDSILLNLVESEKNITLLLNCACMDAKVKKGDYPFGREFNIEEISGYQMTTQTFFDVSAKFFADCSGDSILASLSNAKFRVGRESKEEFGEVGFKHEKDSLTMGNSCLLQLRETTEKVPYVNLEWATDLTEKDFENRMPDLKSQYENFWYLELGGNKNTIEDSEEIAKDLRGLSLGTLQFLKNQKDGKNDNFDLDFLGFVSGKRESRRYIGEYTIKQQDITNGERFNDAVAYGGWKIDDHFPSGFYHSGVPNTDIETSVPYQIPYRILYSKNVSNLFFAGRNVSATHVALSSIRVMATCGVMGQAVGSAVAIAVKYGLTPHGVYLEKIKELQNILLDCDCFIPYLKRQIAKECVESSVINGNTLLNNGEDRKNKIYGDKECGVKVKNGTPLVYEFEKPIKVKSVHVVFNSDLDRDTVDGSWSEKVHITRANRLLGDAILSMPKTLCREFSLTLFKGEEKIKEISITENKLRAYHVEVNDGVTKIALNVKSNYGNFDSTDVFSFDFKV